MSLFDSQDGNQFRRQHALHAGPRQEAINEARAWLESKPIVWDTETTSFTGECIELCAVDGDGNVLLDTLIKPIGTVSDGARAVHQITDDMLAHAPSFKDIESQVHALFSSRRVAIGYNCVGFDVPRIGTSLKAHGLADWQKQINAADAMLLFQKFMGRSRWVKLGEAADICQLSIPHTLHRARADAELTRLLVHYMAEAL